METIEYAEMPSLRPSNPIPSVVLPFMLIIASLISRQAAIALFMSFEKLENIREFADYRRVDI